MPSHRSRRTTFAGNRAAPNPGLPSVAWWTTREPMAHLGSVLLRRRWFACRLPCAALSATSTRAWAGVGSRPCSCYRARCPRVRGPVCYGVADWDIVSSGVCASVGRWLPDLARIASSGRPVRGGAGPPQRWTAARCRAVDGGCLAEGRRRARQWWCRDAMVATVTCAPSKSRFGCSTYGVISWYHSLGRA